MTQSLTATKRASAAFGLGIGAAVIALIAGLLIGGEQPPPHWLTPVNLCG